HTMGLGKTMQVIALLVAITESANSGDATVRSQIPEGLRISKTLIMCPPGLVDNWSDELLAWDPDRILGDIFKVSSADKYHRRRHEIEAWNRAGGVLIIGYQMLRSFLDKGELGDVLLEEPNIVVADEAHNIKNTKSKTRIAASQFRTMSRIALTGS